MGQTGVEPEGKHPSANAMWQNETDRMAKAKDHARMARDRGEDLSAHSIMLSAYITALGGRPIERHHPVKFFLLALWHAFCMFRRRNELNHNQLDVWLQFSLKLRSKLPFLKTGRPLRVKWYPQFDLMLLDGAIHAIKLTEKARAKPHQLALAHMTYAEIKYAVDFRISAIKDHIQRAIELGPKIRAEPDQPQGLRQFVRILRKAGELNLVTGNRDLAMRFFEKALSLAKGEANAPDQIEKIEAFLPTDMN